MDVFRFSVSKYCQLSYSTSISSTFNVFISGAPSSGWANVILKDGNGTLVGSTEIFFFPNVMEAVFMAQTPSPFKNVSTEMRCHTASNFNSGDGDPQIYRALRKFLSNLIMFPQ